MAICADVRGGHACAVETGVECAVRIEADEGEVGAGTRVRIADEQNFPIRLQDHGAPFFAGGTEGGGNVASGVKGGVQRAVAVEARELEITVAVADKAETATHEQLAIAEDNEAVCHVMIAREVATQLPCCAKGGVEITLLGCLGMDGLDLSQEKQPHAQEQAKAGV